VNEDNARKLSEQWGFPVPAKAGLTTAEMIEVADRGGTDVLFATGGDFHEVLPDPERVLSAYSHIGLRVHFDIVPSSQMFIEPGKDAVLLLPAATRYEMPGGVTETTTERRIIFSPEIPGPRIGEARPEWEVYMELARRIRPEWQEHLAFADTAAMRAEIARVIPMYAGIERLAREGDQFQYGGRLLCAGWKFPTADGKAHFHPTTFVPMQTPEHSFQVVQRRGKQFNSNVHEESDPATGLPRDAVMMSAADIGRLGLRDGDAVVLENENGRFSGQVFTADVRHGTLEMYWPEGNVLVSGSQRSPLAKIPAYRDVVARLRRPQPGEAKQTTAHAT
ncbi:MAG: formate dehydrogenase, partial [Gammaproteobacteria bacterium]|nr:formate dehydrogenase [Gammaproteobacteria bacterium]